MDINMTPRCPHCKAKMNFTHHADIPKEGIHTAETKVFCAACGKESIFRATTRTTLVRWNLKAV